MKRAFFRSRFLLQYIAAALAILRRMESVSPAAQIFFVKMRAVPTALVHVLTAFSAVLLLIAPSAPAVIAPRYLSTCMLVMTFLVTTCVLIPMGEMRKRYSGQETVSITMSCAL